MILLDASLEEVGALVHVPDDCAFEATLVLVYIANLFPRPV